MTTIRDKMTEVQAASTGGLPAPAHPVPSAELPRGRFVDCHCGHAKLQHGSQGCGHEKCDCLSYRPRTAPDPVALRQVVEQRDQGALGDLLVEGMASQVASTVKLATRISEMVEDLRKRVEAESEERRLAAEHERRTREARERVERLQRELEEAMAEAGMAKPKRRAPGPRTSVPRNEKAGYKSQTPDYDQDADGNYLCPTCGDAKATKQSVSIHRSRSHGYRAGDGK